MQVPQVGDGLAHGANHSAGAGAAAPPSPPGRGATPDAGRAAPVFAALGDGTRLALVTRLCASGPLSITGLARGADVTRQAVTKHLAVLAAAGLVRSARRGRERIWELEPERLDDAREALRRISARWDEALQRLRAHVEG